MTATNDIKDISLFIPCIVDLSLPPVGVASVRLLRSLGLRPYYHPEQTCCGQVLYNAGLFEKARSVAKHFIEVFENDQRIVCPSASCVKMVRENYLNLFCDMPAWRRRARDLSGRIFELSEYLVDVLQVRDVGASFSGKVAYHESCSLLYGLEISDQPKALISAVRGAELVPMNAADVCCGFGGHFANAYPDISGAMVADKVQNFIESGADCLVLCEPGCLLNIGGYINRHHPGRTVVHLAQFLADHLDPVDPGSGKRK